MPTDEEHAALKQRVAALEDLAAGMRALLQSFARTQLSTAQHDLLPAVVDGTAGSQMVLLRNELVATFERVTGKQYVFEGAKDAAAVKRLLALQPALRAELRARWEECLRMKGYPGTTSLAIFVSRINAFGKAPLPTTPPAAIAGDPYGP